MACNVVALPTAFIQPPERFRIDPLAPPDGVTAFRPWADQTRRSREHQALRRHNVTTDPDRVLLLGTIEALDSALEELGVVGFGRTALREAQTIAPQLDIAMNMLCADAHWELFKARGGPRPPAKKARRGGKKRRL